MAKAPAKKGPKENFKIVTKRSGRFAVLSKSGKYINGEEKVKILVDKGLIKVNLKKKEAAAPAADAAAPQA